MNMMPVGDILIPDNRGSDASRPVRAFQMLHKHLLELLRVSVNEALRIIPEHLHLALVTVRHTMTLEAVLIATLFLAHLAVPLQLLQTLGLDPIGDGLGRQKLVLPHACLQPSLTHSLLANPTLSYPNPNQTKRWSSTTPCSLAKLSHGIELRNGMIYVGKQTTDRCRSATGDDEAEGSSV